jgi:hypothetical protein
VPKYLTRALFGTTRRLVLALNFDVLENGRQLLRGNFTDKTGTEFWEKEVLPAPIDSSCVHVLLHRREQLPGYALETRVLGLAGDHALSPRVLTLPEELSGRARKRTGVA